MYLAIEGKDHVGKSKQIELLAERLKNEGRDVVVVREPGSTPLAEDLRNCIKNIYADRTDYMEHLLMFTTARYSLLKHVIVPALEAGKVVISDRCWISSLFYQVMESPAATEERDAAMDVLRVPLNAFRSVRPHVLVLFNEKLAKQLSEGRDALEDVNVDVVARRDHGYAGLTGRAPFQDQDARMLVTGYTQSVSHVTGDLLSIEEIHELIYERFVALENSMRARRSSKGIQETLVG